MLRHRTVIMNDENEYLSFDCVWFVNEKCNYFSSYEPCKAIMAAHHWWRVYGLKSGKPLIKNRKVFVVTNYNCGDEIKREILHTGEVIHDKNIIYNIVQLSEKRYVITSRNNRKFLDYYRVITKPLSHNLAIQMYEKLFSKDGYDNLPENLRCLLI